MAYVGKPGGPPANACGQYAPREAYRPYTLLTIAGC